MEIKCREAIETAIKNHRVLMDKLYEETSAAVSDPAGVVSAQPRSIIGGRQLLKEYSYEEAAKRLQKQINYLVASQNAMDKLFNARVKAALDSVREAVIPEEVRNFTKPYDYQQQVSNALSFLAVEGKDLTDKTAHSILKPFFNDWDQMHLFERVILQQTGMDDEVSLRHAFPASLGFVLNRADTYLALFNEADMLAENIFLSEKTADKSCKLDEFTVLGGYGSDSYTERAAQDRLLELAGRIDSLLSDKPFTYPAGSIESGQVG